MKTWLIIYGLCGVTFTTFMYFRNLRKNAISFTTKVQQALKNKKTIGEHVIEIIGTGLALCAVSALWIFFLCWLIYEKYFEKKYSEIGEVQKFNATKDFLISIIDPKLEESNHIICDPLGRVPKLPFGHLNQAWVCFLENTESSDVIWSFEIKIGDLVTPWYSKQKRPSSRSIKGYACLRDGDVVNEFIYESS